MHAHKPLPEGYQPAATIDLAADRHLLLALNAASLVVLIFSGWFFLWLLLTLRPSASAVVSRQIVFRSFGAIVLPLLVILLLTVINTFLHEGLHGLFFWRYSREKPRFGFKGAYAYAAAPEWYFTRGAFLNITLAPLAIISLSGVLLFLIVPQAWLLSIWFILVINASGSVGDLLVAAWLLAQPANSLMNDRGDAVTVFRQEEKNARKMQNSD